MALFGFKMYMNNDQTDIFIQIDYLNKTKFIESIKIKSGKRSLFSFHSWPFVIVNDDNTNNYNDNNNNDNKISNNSYDNSNNIKNKNVNDIINQYYYTIYLLLFIVLN